jgi:hypothetical protein
MEKKIDRKKRINELLIRVLNNAESNYYFGFGNFVKH